MKARRATGTNLFSRITSAVIGTPYRALGTAVIFVALIVGVLLFVAKKKKKGKK